MLRNDNLQWTDCYNFLTHLLQCQCGSATASRRLMTLSHSSAWPHSVSMARLVPNWRPRLVTVTLFYLWLYKCLVGLSTWPTHSPIAGNGENEGVDTNSTVDTVWMLVNDNYDDSCETIVCVGELVLCIVAVLGGVREAAQSPITDGLKQGTCISSKILL